MYAAHVLVVFVVAGQLQSAVEKEEPQKERTEEEDNKLIETIKAEEAAFLENRKVDFVRVH